MKYKKVEKIWYKKADIYIFMMHYIFYADGIVYWQKKERHSLYSENCVNLVETEEKEFIAFNFSGQQHLYEMIS